MLRDYQKIDRRISKPIKIGDVKIGGGATISVQTMTNTLTHNIDSTLSQIERVKNVGADIVRVSVPDKESSKALNKSTDQFQNMRIQKLSKNRNRGNFLYILFECSF